MRNYHETRARIQAIESALLEVRENFACEQALCLKSDKPWRDFRVLLVTRDRVLQAADDVVASVCGGNISEALVSLDSLTEAAVWTTVCELLDKEGLFCAWPVNEQGQDQFLKAIAGLEVEKEAQALVSSIPRGQNPGRPWKAYQSQNLQRVIRAAACSGAGG